MFFGALPPLIESLYVLPRQFAGGLFTRDFVPYWQTSSSASNVPSQIKLRSRQKRSSFSCSEEEKRLILNQQFLPKNIQFQPSNLSGFSPTAFHHRVIARHSSPQLRVSAVSVCLRSQGPFGLFMVRAGPCAQGYYDCVGSAPFWINV